ncbi:spore coat associated protein CotJA [Paenibacillus thermotolerans]|uniref:spore coat associated protein CotJA n=1 Tax=Paenibacillus thermotolerans TaxID=3027807 RepID=UPI0023675CCA|nr:MULTISPECIES: spore coat associated protein CotJA [unclassified Paenibacillus]
MLNQVKIQEIPHAPFDPCPPLRFRTYVIPPNIYAPFQSPGLPQFSPAEALRHGTLWPAYYSPYEGPKGAMKK